MNDIIYCTGDELNDNVPVPSANANVGSIERAFCKIAHAAVRGDHANGDPFACPCLRAWQCGLANYDHPCLFHVPDDPLWDRIRQSIQLEPQAQPG